MDHLDEHALAAGLAAVGAGPADVGTLEMIVRRPGVNEREVLAEGQLTTEDGLVGDHWLARGSRYRPDRSADPERQLTLMSSRVVNLMAGGDRTAWPLAGDQLYVDLDLSIVNLPAGTRLAIGGAVIEVTVPSHDPCPKFVVRFGQAANDFVSTPEGKASRLRGLHARVVKPGLVRQGDTLSKI